MHVKQNGLVLQWCFSIAEIRIWACAGATGFLTLRVIPKLSFAICYKHHYHQQAQWQLCCSSLNKYCSLQLAASGI